MDPLQLLILLAIAGICGAFAQLAIAFDTRGIATILVSVIIGIVGIFLANSITEATGLSTFVVRVGAQRVDLLLTILGAMLLLAALRLVRSGGRTLLGGGA